MRKSARETSGKDDKSRAKTIKMAKKYLDISDELIEKIPTGFPVLRLLNLEINAKGNENMVIDEDIDMLPDSGKTPESIAFVLEYLQSKGIKFFTMDDLQYEIIPPEIDVETMKSKLGYSNMEGIGSSEECFILGQLYERLERDLSELLRWQRDVIELRFGLRDGRAWSLTEISNRFGLPLYSVLAHRNGGIRRLRQKNKGSDGLLFLFLAMIQKHPSLSKMIEVKKQNDLEVKRMVEDEYSGNESEEALDELLNEMFSQEL